MPRMTVVWKINLLVLGGMVLLLGAAVGFGLVQSGGQAEGKVRLALTGADVAASLVLDPEQTAAWTPETAAGPEYEALEGRLKRLAAAFGLSDLYVVRPAGSDSWEFVFDTADGPFNEDQGREGGFSTYDSPPEELAEAWKGQEPVVTAQPYTDEFGTFRSAFLVLPKADGTPVAVVGADFNLAQLQAVREQHLWLSVVLASVGLVLIGVLGWILVRMIDVPLGRVSARFGALASGKADLSEHVEHRSRDELGDLARGFNDFVDKLRALVGDLRTGVSETARVQLLLQRDSEETQATLAQTRQGLEALTASGAVLESSLQQVVRSLESMAAQGRNLEALAQAQRQATDRAAQDHGVLDREASALRTQTHAVGKALAELDQESAENTRRMEAELALLQQLSRAVEAVHGIVATLGNTADSTGLLAMNASIEAAHAGLQGRGFAVIAQRMRLQAETSRADADRIGETLNRMVDLIGQAALGAQETARGAEATHGRIAAAHGLVAQLTAAGDHLEAYTGRNRAVLEELRQASQGVAESSGAVAQGTAAIMGSTEELNQAAQVVLGGVHTIREGAIHLAAVVEDIREVADRLTSVSRSLEENLLRIRA